MIFVVSLALSVGFTLLARRIAPALGLMDKPGGRRIHPGPIARLGALPLWAAFTITAVFAQSLPVERTDGNELIRLSGLLLGGTFLFFFGLADDKFELSSFTQYIGQLIAASIGVIFLIFIQHIHNPFNQLTTEDFPYIVTITVSLFWLGLMMNTLNFLDGVDGLAGGVTLIAAILLFYHTFSQGQLSVSLLPMALIGTTLGFLIFNWYPAKIFMGSGAVYLGYIVGALSIIGGAKLATILLVMGLPLLDVAWQVVRRIREGKNPMTGDRGHLHFRLIDAGISPRLICLGYYLFCGAFGLLAVQDIRFISGPVKVVAVIIMVILALIGFTLAGRLPNRNGDNQNGT